MENGNKDTETQVAALDTLWNTPELCDYLGITRDTLYEWREVNTAPPGFKLPNGQLRFPVSGVLAWLAERQRAA